MVNDEPNGLGGNSTLFGTNHAPAKRGMKVPSPPLKSSLFEFKLTSGGEGTCHREEISVPKNIECEPPLPCGANLALF